MNAAATSARARPLVPPNDLVAEESVLGAVLLSRSARSEAIETGLGAEDFYRPAHGHIWAAVVSLDARAEPVDAVTVADELRRHGLLELAGWPGPGGPAGRYAKHR